MTSILGPAFSFGIAPVYSTVTQSTSCLLPEEDFYPEGQVDLAAFAEISVFKLNPQ